MWGDCLFNSEPNKKLRLTPPLARDEQAFEFGSLWFGVNRVERVEIFNHGLHGFARMYEVGLISCRI